MLSTVEAFLGFFSRISTYDWPLAFSEFLLTACCKLLAFRWKGFSEVWFARHDEVARWVLDQE